MLYALATDLACVGGFFSSAIMAVVETAERGRLEAGHGERHPRRGASARVRGFGSVISRLHFISNGTGRIRIATWLP